MIRSIEGMHQSDATKRSSDGAPEASEGDGALDVPASPPPIPGERGPRYESLVVYPSAAPTADERNSVTRDAVDTYVIPDESNPNHDESAVAESPSDDELTRKLEAIPAEPGVYILRDRNAKVLYVGKAKSLRPRVRSYFREGGDGRFQVRFLMRQVRDFETLVARSEKEALIL